MRILLLLLALALLAGGFIYRMGHGDSRAIAAFLTSYQTYDEAVAALENAPAPDVSLEPAADGALSELRSRASARISSLTRNDGVYMSLTAEIATLAGRELSVLKAWRRAVASKDDEASRLAKGFAELKRDRKAAFARVQALEGAP